MGPAVNNYEKILELIDAGMNVARINFSHGTHEDHKKTIDLLKRAREEKKIPLAIMLDTKGPEIRIGILPKEMAVERGQKVLLVPEKTQDPAQLPIVPGIALESLEKDDIVLFDDGYIGSQVLERTKEGVVVEILNKGVLKSQKGVSMPGVDVPLPAMTEQDIEDIKFGCAQDVDIIAASFIRSARHVREIKALLYDQNKSDILVIAKIENSLGVQNFESIVQVADGIMVARGDLGVELPIEDVPVLQKMMIRKCVHASKPVVTATQMLESMMHHPRPTRAEASDVANAIYDSTSAVMLSGETAVGQYPIETLKIMRSIIEAAEEDFPFLDFFYRDSRVDSHDISSSISLASVKTAYSSGAKAIFAFTSSGFTARMISRFRPQMPILALTPHVKTYHQLGFNWGVIPVDPTHTETVHEALAVTSAFARSKELVEFGDLIVLTAGSPFGVSGTTNMMIVESIGEVLVRGDPSEGAEIDGQVSIVLTPDEFSAKAAIGKIVVIAKYDETYFPVIEKAKGILLQNHPEDIESEEEAIEAAKELNIPIIVRADEALRRLQERQLITMNPERGMVYRKKARAEEEEVSGISDPRD